jgi:hypothetical protein
VFDNEEVTIYRVDRDAVAAALRSLPATDAEASR